MGQQVGRANFPLAAYDEKADLVLDLVVARERTLQGGADISIVRMR